MICLEVGVDPCPALQDCPHSDCWQVDRMKLENVPGDWKVYFLIDDPPAMA